VLTVWGSNPTLCVLILLVGNTSVTASEYKHLYTTLTTQFTMATETEERRTIKIKVDTHEKLKKQGVYGETMDEIINRLMFQEKEKNKGKTAGYEGAI